MTTPPALLKVNVEIPAWPAVDRARRRVDAVRSATGRVATVAGFAAAAVGLFTPEVTGSSLLATAVLSAAGVATLRLWKPDGQQRAVATVMYLMPGTGLAALLVAERIVTGIHWGEALALAVWTIGTGLLRPARIARQMLTPPPPAPAAELAEVVEVVDDHPAAQWWTQNVAIVGGDAPATVLEDIEVTGPKSMRAVIRSAVPGRPVPEVSVKGLSALMDVPEEEIKVGPVPGRGAGVKLLAIGKAAEETDATTVWAQQIAPAAMPGAVLTGVRIGRPGITSKETSS